jgi:hypothetical protein
VFEVADFIMHSVGRQARHNLKKRGDFDRRLTSYMEVDSVTITGDEVATQPAS